MQISKSFLIALAMSSVFYGCGKTQSTSSTASIEANTATADALTTTTSNSPLLFQDDFDQPDAKRIDSSKWAMWSNSEVSLVNRRAAEPSDQNPYGFALAKDLLVEGNFNISADYAIVGPEKLGKYVKLWAICGPNVKSTTTTLNGGKGTKRYQAQIMVNQYLQRVSEIAEDTPPLTATSGTKVIGGNSPRSGRIALNVSAKKIQVLVDDQVKSAIDLPSNRIDHKCRVVFGLRQFTLDNLKVQQVAADEFRN